MHTYNLFKDINLSLENTGLKTNLCIPPLKKKKSECLESLHALL